MRLPEVVAILSPGEMGHAVGRFLGGRGLRVITSLEGRSERTMALARAGGIEDVGSLDRVVDEADLLLSIVPSDAAPRVASQVARRLHRRSRPLTFVECNAMSPDSVRGMSEEVSSSGGHVVDVGIIGGPPTDSVGPRFYASGPFVDEFSVLETVGLDVRLLGPEIGRASGMKMCYAALTKGLSALGTELMLAAAKLDLMDPLTSELAHSQPQALDILERSLPGVPSKSRRWVSEMQEIAKTLASLGLSAGYHQAAAGLYEWMGSTGLGQQPPESRDPSRTLRSTIEQLATEHSATAVKAKEAG